MRTRTKILLPVVGVLVAALAFGAYWFQPWKLLTNDTVHDALPPVAAVGETGGDATPAGKPSTPPSAPKDVLLARGSFVSHEHGTSGTASIVRLANGKLVLAIANLDTSEGPDVHVWLTDRTVTKSGWHVFDDGYHVDLGSLKGNLGSLLYAIPDSVDLAKVRSVTIWCDRFDVSFGAAQLTPVA